MHTAQVQHPGFLQLFSQMYQNDSMANGEEGCCGAHGGAHLCAVYPIAVFGNLHQFLMASAAGTSEAAAPARAHLSTAAADASEVRSAPLALGHIYLYLLQTLDALLFLVGSGTILYCAVLGQSHLNMKSADAQSSIENSDEFYFLYSIFY